MTSYQGYLIDLDGTIYQGKNKMASGKRFIERLQKANIPYLFLTNNSTKTPQQVAQNLTVNHDIKATAEQVYSSALATVDYLESISTDSTVKTAYAIGEAGLKTALQAAGYTLTAKQPTYVIVGMDMQATYAMFETATLAIQNGAQYIATNLDTNIPNERGNVPGAGSLNALVTYATGVKPLEIGKPSTIIMDYALKKMGLKHNEVVMVGDNYHTDILAGIRAGIPTLLTYTGISTISDVAKQVQQPTHEVKNLDEWQI
ncbi:TIGR01457 family HAD-type hydrolase [Periweissella beninensis]|uniref:TIGR01457 family HAD-type hydrolase n=1 Tax=Periweissella beninensis TaxID=504936 RepID=UPI0021A3A180|nr:TIGR01457 family HAD-type hydrolase [Periweissella beninensis]MCT4396890.1 TIGR01457 family HAD-type hydrolase [Periweissella beninensis]